MLKYSLLLLTSDIWKATSASILGIIIIFIIKFLFIDNLNNNRIINIKNILIFLFIFTISMEKTKENWLFSILLSFCSFIVSTIIFYFISKLKNKNNIKKE